MLSQHDDIPSRLAEAARVVAPAMLIFIVQELEADHIALLANREPLVEGMGCCCNVDGRANAELFKKIGDDRRQDRGLGRQGSKRPRRALGPSSHAPMMALPSTVLKRGTWPSFARRVAVLDRSCLARSGDSGDHEAQPDPAWPTLASAHGTRHCPGRRYAGRAPSRTRKCVGAGCLLESIRLLWKTRLKLGSVSSPG